MALTEAQRAGIERRVDDGVWFLDHVMPDWAWHVDLSKLKMTGSIPGECSCVLVQATGMRYFDAIDFLGGVDSWFSGFADGTPYAHELWQEAVLDRRPNVLIGGERVPA